jgi:hypothetical protein
MQTVYKLALKRVGYGQPPEWEKSAKAPDFLQPQELQTRCVRIAENDYLR